MSASGVAEAKKGQHLKPMINLCIRLLTQNVFHHVWIPIWCGMCLGSSPSSIDFTWFMKLCNYIDCLAAVDMRWIQICVGEYACTFFLCKTSIQPSWILRISNKNEKKHTHTHITYAHQVTDRMKNEFSCWFMAERKQSEGKRAENMTHLWANAT